MLSIAETRKALAELRAAKESGVLKSYAYDRQKARILQKALLDEESGARHRYPTRRRLLDPPLTTEKKAPQVVFDMDDFIDDRDSSEFTVGSESYPSDSIESASEEPAQREDHHFPKEIVIDCSSIRRDGKSIGFPPNFFKQVYTK